VPSAIPVGLEQDVLGLDVAVDDVVLVGVAQGIGHLAGDLERVGKRKLPLPLESVAEGFPLHVGHYVIQEARGRARVVQRQDVRVAQLRRDLDLAQESLGAH